MARGFRVRKDFHGGEFGSASAPSKFCAVWQSTASASGGLLRQRGSGQDWIRTSEGVSQRIYSPPRLATSVPTREKGGALYARASGAASD